MGDWLPDVDLLSVCPVAGEAGIVLNRFLLRLEPPRVLVVLGRPIELLEPLAVLGVAAGLAELVVDLVFVGLVVSVRLVVGLLDIAEASLWEPPGVLRWVDEFVGRASPNLEEGLAGVPDIEAPFATPEIVGFLFSSSEPAPAFVPSSTELIDGLDA